MFEVQTNGRHPFPDFSNEEIISYLSKGERPPIGKKET